MTYCYDVLARRWRATFHTPCVWWRARASSPSTRSGARAHAWALCVRRRSACDRLFTIRPRARTTVKARPEGKRRKDCGSCSQKNFFERGCARLVVSRRADTIAYTYGESGELPSRDDLGRSSLTNDFFFRQFAKSLELSLFSGLFYCFQRWRMICIWGGLKREVRYTCHDRE